MHLRLATLTAVLATVILLAPAAAAENIDLVTLPDREGVQLTIYNSEDITLVKETRNVTFKEGVNRLQFSWHGTLIDPTSVEFRPLTHAAEIEVADTVFPGQKPQSLFWNVESEFEGQVPCEVKYFTSGLTWRMDYVAVTGPGEELLDFDGYVRVFNFSGEEYEDAEVRLIVGNINLVEKIADLARRAGIVDLDPANAIHSRLEKLAFEESVTIAGRLMEDAGADIGIGGGAGAATGKKIVKEGVSEYFMFGIEGTETIRNGWSKRMRAVKAEEVAFDIVYRMRAHQYGARPVRFFIWKNDEEHKLGESPLPDGLIRVFRENGKDGLSYLGEQLVRYVPITADIEVNLGPDDLVVYETRRMSTKRFNFKFKRRNRKDYVVGWDEEQKWADTIRNYRTKPITFELRRIWNGDVTYESETTTELFDYRTAEAKFEIGAREAAEYAIKLVFRMGENKKQDSIKLK